MHATCYQKHRLGILLCLYHLIATSKRAPLQELCGINLAVQITIHWRGLRTSLPINWQASCSCIQKLKHKHCLRAAMFLYHHLYVGFTATVNGHKQYCTRRLTNLGGCTGEQDAQSLSVQTIISSALAGPQHGPAAQATADLLLSCLQGKPSPAQELAHTLHALLDLPAPHTSRSQAPSGGTDTKGAALGVLLVQRLLQTVVQHPSQVLDWRHHDLDSLACHLVKVSGSTSASESSVPADKHQSSFGAESGRLKADDAAADTASLAASVASAPLDASEQTAAAQETPVSDISYGLAHVALQQAGGCVQAGGGGVQAGGGGVQGISSRAHLLGVLISGKGNVSLLTDHAVQQVLSHFKASLESTGDQSGMMMMIL